MATLLDYEREQSFHIEVIALDNPGGSSHNIETCSINIRVEDVNDNSPVFTQLCFIHSDSERECRCFHLHSNSSGQFIIFSAHQLL